MRYERGDEIMVHLEDRSVIAIVEEYVYDELWDVYVENENKTYTVHESNMSPKVIDIIRQRIRK